jgi:hypothetical protein
VTGHCACQDVSIGGLVSEMFVSYLVQEALYQRLQLSLVRRCGPSYGLPNRGTSEGRCNKIPVSDALAVDAYTFVHAAKTCWAQACPTVLHIGIFLGSSWQWHPDCPKAGMSSVWEGP